MMLENIRENSQGVIAKVILGFIILTFAVAGIGSYSNAVDTSVAEVNGQKISKNDFDKAYQNQRARMSQQFGDMFDTLAADTAYMANFRNGVLDNLINEALLDQSAENLAMRVSDQRLKQTIREMPEFQVDGVFDNDRYLMIIRQAGFLQSSSFRDYLRVEMKRRQLSQALVASEFSLPYQETDASILQNQKRSLRFATISAEQFKATTVVSAEEVNTYYADNQTRFETQEKVKLNYLLLDVNEIAKDLAISDEDISVYYQDNIDNYREAEQRRVAHILIEFGDDEEQAKVQAEQILARVQQGEDFALLAKEFSTDSLSAENGGDLEWIQRNDMDPTFEDSAFALAEIGALSELVKSEYGFHIIKLTDLKAEKTTPLADIREQLLAQVSKDKAQDKFFEVQQTMAELSFESPDSLEEAAQGVNLTVQTSDWLTRRGNSQPFDNRKVIDVAFSDLVLMDNVNSDVIEINDNLAIVVHLNEHQEAKVKPLTDVEAQIKTLLVTEKSSQKAKDTAKELLEKFQAGNDITADLAQVNAGFVVKTEVSRTGGDVEQNVRQAVFVLPAPSPEKVSASTVTLANGDIALVELQAVITGEATPSPSLAQQQTSQLAQSAFKSYVETLKLDASIVRKTVTDDSLVN